MFQRLKFVESNIRILVGHPWTLTASSVHRSHAKHEFDEADPDLKYHK